MKKKSFPIYPPPIPILADYYHPPKGAKKALEKNNSAPRIARKVPVYSPPIPSLADYYHADIPDSNRSILEKSSKKTKNVPQSKKTKKNK